MEHKVNSQMISIGREAKGLTQKELATKIGITQGALSAFERGDKNPSKEVLNAMGELLEVPQTFFHYPADIISPSIIYYRKRSSMSKKTNAKIVALINIKRIQINELTKGVEIENSIDYIEPDSKKTPEHIARYTRQILNVPVGPITDIVNLIERAGIIICYIDIDDKKFDAVSFITENGQPVIFINSSFPNDRKTYSLAHELGHITQHLSFKIDLDRDYEKEADNFASEFLMPELDIKHHLHGLTLGRLATLKKHWKVSMASLLMRAKKLKLLTENQSKYLWMQMAKAGYRKKEPQELEPLFPPPQLLGAIIKEHIEGLNYKPTDLASQIIMHADELQDEYLKQPKIIKIR